MILAFRIVLCCVGGLLLAFGLFLYEDEERQLQNRLEDLWVWLDDTRRAALAAERNLVSATALRVSSILNWVFGPDLVSVRAITTSVALSVLCASLIATPQYLSRHIATHQTHGGFRVVIVMMLLGTGLMLWSRFLEEERARLAIVAAGALFSFLALLYMYGLDWRFRSSFVFLPPLLRYLAQTWVESLMQMGSTLLALAMSTAADSCVLVFLRYALKRISVSTFAGATLSAIGTIMVAVLFWYLPFQASLLASDTKVAAFWRLLSHLNAADAIMMFLALATVGLLSVHHLLWPSLMRPLYAVQRTGIVANKKSLCAVGMSLITAGLAPSVTKFFASQQLNPIWEAIRKVIGG